MCVPLSATTENPQTNPINNVTVGYCELKPINTEHNPETPRHIVTVTVRPRYLSLTTPATKQPIEPTAIIAKVHRDATCMLLLLLLLRSDNQES